MPSALSEADRVRARHHCGYLNIEQAGAIALGFPSAQQPEFLLEKAMDRIIHPSAASRIVGYLNIMDKIECQMVEALGRLKVQQLGELKLRNTNDERGEGDMLEVEYLRWAKRLADDLGCPLNPFSERFRNGAGGSINVPVASGY